MDRARAREVDRQNPMQLPEDAKNSRIFTDLMVEIERQIDVNAIAIDGVQLWPLIRARIRKPFKVVDTYDRSRDPAVTTMGSDSTVSSAKSSRRKASSRLPRLIKRFLGRPSPVDGTGSGSARPMRTAETEADVRARVEAELDKLAVVGPVDYAVFARPNKYYQTLGGKRYAPILDPVFEDLRRRGTAVVLCEGRPESECVNQPTVFETVDYMSLRRYRPKPTFPEAVDRIGDVQRLLVSAAPQYELDAQKVIFRYNSHNHKREFYRELLSRLGPKIVFFSSFTSWVPLIWACREAGIPTVDIQHGGQSAHHGFNTHYSTVPPSGYVLLPDFFWCWGNQNQAIVGRWFPGGANRHIPLVCGNRWKAKWEGGKGMELLSAEERNFVHDLDAREAVVLVTLSHGVATSKLLSRALRQAIRNMRECYWLIRLHPINRTAEIVAELEAILAAEGLSNAEFHLSTMLPLHVVLQHSHCHLSPFSTAAREAVDLGVPTTIIDPIGRMDFFEDIESGLFGYAETTDEIVEAVADALRTVRSGASRLLETDDRLVDDLLARVERWSNETRANEVSRAAD